MLHVMILAGGSGKRFWPKSRAALPKQFLSFGSRKTLLEETYDRVVALVPPERVWVLTHQDHRGRVRELLPQVPEEQVVGEPCARDTAAALALGALLLRHRDPAATVIVVPADQRIEPVARFVAALESAAQLLELRPGAIVVFGVPPRGPETGFGYIEQGELVARLPRGLEGYEVRAFREKPDRETAERYLADGRYCWNAGMFCFGAGEFLARVAEFLPDLSRRIEGLDPGAPGFAGRLSRVYPELPRISVDYGILEPCHDRLVVRVDFEWDDVGSWPAVARHHPADAAGNAVLGPAVLLDARRNVVDAGDGLVALCGVEDLIVVHSRDVTLVCRKDRAEQVKTLLEKVQESDDLRRYL